MSSGVSPNGSGVPRPGGEAAVDRVGVDREVDTPLAELPEHLPEDGADPPLPHRIGGI
jgi:hypothetical protein